jgi:N-hydroxyarylamine O-acetyltransferase
VRRVADGDRLSADDGVVRPMTGGSPPHSLSDAAAAAYLDRLGLSPDEARPPAAATLERLQRRHLLAVPFENLDVVRDERVTVDPVDAFEKVVDRGRGGFCYELNGLFGALLSRLGFDVRYVEGRVRREAGVSEETDDGDGDGGGDGTGDGDETADGGRAASAAVRFGPPFDHLAVLVRVDSETYLADVGFGRFARRPLSLSGAPRSDREGTYRVRRIDEGVYEAQERVSTDDAADRDDAAGRADDAGDDAGDDADDRWTPVYQFTDAARSLDEFRAMCEFHQTSPDSPFTGGPFCTRATRSGRVTFSGDALTVTEGETKRREAVPPTDRTRVLRERFGMSDPPADF